MTVPNPAGSAPEKWEPTRWGLDPRADRLRQLLLDEGVNETLAAGFARALGATERERTFHRRELLEQFAAWANAHTHDGGTPPVERVEAVFALVGNRQRTLDPTTGTSLGDDNILTSYGPRAVHPDGIFATAPGSSGLLHVWPDVSLPSTGRTDLAQPGGGGGMYGLAFDRDGNLYGYNRNSVSTIRRWDAGTYTVAWSNTTTRGSGAYGGEAHLSVNAAGELVGLDSQNKYAWKVRASDGVEVAKSGVFTSNPIEIQAAPEGHCFVSDNGGRVMRLSSDLATVEWTQTFDGSVFGVQLALTPEGLHAVDQSKMWRLLDPATGAVLDSLSLTGRGHSFGSFVGGLHVGPTGLRFVYDYSNTRLTAWDDTWALLWWSSGTSDQYGGMETPGQYATWPEFWEQGV